MTEPKDVPANGAIEIMEEVIQLLRRAPLQVHASYCFGSFPFLLGLLFFWADMSKSGLAHMHLSGEAFFVTLLFIWMKCWHVIYARQLLAQARNEQPERWAPIRIVRMTVRQTIVHSSGLFLLPLSLVAVVPFGWTYALYQTMTVLEDGSSTEIMSFVKEAQRFSRPWQKQNLVIMWALSPYLLMIAAVFFLVGRPIIAEVTADWTRVFLGFYFAILWILLLPLSPLGMIISVNVGLLLVLLPRIIENLTGIQTSFTLGMTSMFNSTFFAAVCGLTYLCMDPLIKAAYVLRFFYISSETTGDDLRVTLKEAFSKISAIIIMSLLLSGAGAAIARDALAQQSAKMQFEGLHSSVSPSELDRALDVELQERRYAWRMPRLLPAKENSGFAASFMRDAANMLADWGVAVLRRIQPLIDWFGKIIDWLRERSPDFGGAKGSLQKMSPKLRFLLFSLIAIFCVIASAILWRVWKKRKDKVFVVAAEVVKAVPDIEKETTTAADLPEDGWLALARDLIERGELRLALRAVFLASLAFLARVNFIHIALFKSNRDYRRELERRAHAHPELPKIFSQSTSIYESVWYGTYEPRRELVDRLLENQQKLRTYETP